MGIRYWGSNISEPFLTLWVSRLTTATRLPIANGGGRGAIAAGNDGASFEAFWFEAAGGSMVRVVVVKRDSKGFVLWSCWTSADFGDTATSRDNSEPQVLGLPDGGCIVVCKGTGGGTAISAWRLDTNGNQTWRQDYTGDLVGAIRVTLSSSEIAILTASNVFIPSSGVSRRQPTVLKIALGSGAVTACNAYRIDNTLSNITPGIRDNIFVLSSGAVVLKIGPIFVETNNSGTTITRCVIFSGSGEVMNGLATVLPVGGYLCRDDSQTLVRLDSSFNITDRYKHSNAMQSGGVFWGLQTLALEVNTSGEGYALSYGFASGEFLGVSFKVVKFTSYGASPVGYNEIAYGSNIGAPEQSISYDIDLSNEYGLARVVGSTSGCSITALGFTLNQPISTASNTTPAATLNTGSCSNTMSVRGWDSVSYSTLTPDDITRTVISATVTSISITTTTGALSMVDASSTLTWSRSELI
jgi:hypothetical protein